MSSEDQWIKMTPSILETMLYNLGHSLENSEVTVRFNTNEEREKFKQLMNDKIDNEQEILNFDQGDQEQQEEEESQAKQVKVEASFSDSQHNSSSTWNQSQTLEVKEVSIKFTESIILKLKYSQHLLNLSEKIGGVTFRVVPEKLKITAINEFKLEEADEEFYNLYNRLHCLNLSQYGKEVYNSKYYRNKLNSYGINIEEILGTYCLWYEAQDDTQIREQFENFFIHIKHKSYPLYNSLDFEESIKLNSDVQSEMNLFNKYPKQYLPTFTRIQGDQEHKKLKQVIYHKMIISLKAKIFSKKLESALNDLLDDKSKKIQLSLSEEELIMHGEAEQQFSMLEGQIQEMYKCFSYCYLTFDKQEENIAQKMLPILKKQQTKAELENLNFKKKKVNQEANSHLFYVIQQSEDNPTIICLGYQQSKNRQPNYVHPLHSLIQDVPQQLLCFKITLPILFDDTIQDERFYTQRDHFEKVTHLGCKSNTKQRYGELIKIYMVERLEKKQKIVQQQHSKLLQQEPSVSTILNETENLGALNDSQLNTSNILNEKQDESILINQKQESKLTQKQKIEKIMDKVEKYKIFIQEKEKDQEKKYGEFQNLKKGSLTMNKDLQKVLQEVTENKYKIYKVNIPDSHKQALKKVYGQSQEKSKMEEIITLFCINKENFVKPYDSQKALPVHFIGKHHQMKNHGYLINTKKNFINIQEKYMTIDMGKYEVVYSIDRIE